MTWVKVNVSERPTMSVEDVKAMIEKLASIIGCTVEIREGESK